MGGAEEAGGGENLIGHSNEVGGRRSGTAGSGQGEENNSPGKLQNSSALDWKLTCGTAGPGCINEDTRTAIGPIHQ